MVVGWSKNGLTYFLSMAEGLYSNTGLSRVNGLTGRVGQLSKTQRHARWYVQRVRSNCTLP